MIVFIFENTLASELFPKGKENYGNRVYREVIEIEIATFFQNGKI